MQFVLAERERHSDDGKPPVAWERYLEVTPVLVDLDPAAREEALTERNLDAAVWARAETYWLLTFALDLAAGRNDRVDSFGRACAATRRPKTPATSAPPAGALASPAVASVKDVTDTTSDAMPVYRPPALPFGQTPSPEHAALLAGSSAPAPAPAPRSASPARPDATVMDMGPARAPALPFANGKAAAKLPELSLDQHAQLSAELAIGAAGAKREELLRRYGIDGPDMLTRLGVEWQLRMTTDSTLASQWRAAYARHRAALQESQRRR